MPTYDGHSIVTERAKISSAKSKTSINSDVGIKVVDGHLGSTHRISNHKVMGNIGAAHKGTIKCCVIDIEGQLIATGAEDKRVMIWSIKNTKAIMTLEGHGGCIHQVEFSADGEQVFASSDDGNIIVWEVKSGTQLHSFLVHPDAVRTFDFNYNFPHILVCGRNDGYISVWNIAEKLKIDEISPYSKWLQDKQVRSEEKNINHQGSILCVRISFNRQFLATASNDGSCKIWKISSYQKDITQIRANLQQQLETSRRYTDYIDVLDETYDDQFDLQSSKTLKMGELEISPGYHADLKVTCMHEGPVSSCAFTSNSEALVTGSTDCTCRIWSVKKGEQLFQINLPDAVNYMDLDYNDNLYLYCGTRLLQFRVDIPQSDEDVPQYWKPLNKRAQNQVEHTEKTAVSVSDLKKLIAHGLVTNETLNEIVDSFQSINKRALADNMKKFNVNYHQIMRLLANSDYATKDVLAALSSSNATAIYALINQVKYVNQGESINKLLSKLGFNPADRTKSNDPTFMLNLKPVVVSHKEFHTDFGWNRKDKEDKEFESEDEGDDLDFAYRPKGRVIHFIPSVQMKLLKELYEQSVDLKPVFLRSLATENIRYDKIAKDNKDVAPKVKLPQTRTTERFNETLRGNAIRKIRNKKPGVLRRGLNYRNRADHPENVDFNPEALLKTIGLNVSFPKQNQELKAPKSSKTSDSEFEKMTEAIFAMPIVFEGNPKERYAQIVGPAEAILDTGLLLAPEDREFLYGTFDEYRNIPRPQKPSEHVRHRSRSSTSENYK